MPAYVIVNADITDTTAYAEYRDLATPTVSAYGGKYLVRGGPLQVIEGKWAPKRLVILEFESIEHAKRWYESPEYGKALRIRQKAAISDLVFVEGI